MKKNLFTAAVSAALLLGIADISAYAAGITIGGDGNSAVSATVGGSTANVNVGNGAGPLATVNNTGSPTGNGSTTNANVNLGNLTNGGSANGALARVDSNGNLLGDDSSTNAGLDLGNLLAGLNLGGLGGIGGGGGGGGLPGGGNGNGPGAGNGGMGLIFASLSASDQSALRLRCRTILSDPTIYKADVVTFCRMIAKL